MAAIVLGVWLGGSQRFFALNPLLDISQYAHTAWTLQDDSFKGAIRAIVQTPDGYLWLGTEFGLVRFDGVRFVAWNPPAGHRLPSTNIQSLFAARDGTLWIGTVEGLASWKDGRLNEYGEFTHQNVLTLLEDREGTVWAGTFQVPRAKLCSIQQGQVDCYGKDGSLGQWVWSLYEDGKGRVWAGTETGLWRWKPGPPARYPMPHPIETYQSIVEGDNRTGLLTVGEGVWQFADQKISHYRMATPPGRLTPVSVFRDRDGGLWVGTLQRGLLHVYHGKTTVFSQNDGLSGDRVRAIFEDREGNVWVGTTNGLDRFRETTVFSVSARQGLSDPSVQAVLVARDHSVWLSTQEGLNRWNNGHVTIYWPGAQRLKENARPPASQYSEPAFYIGAEEKAVTEIFDRGLPDTTVGSLCEDQRGRIWVSTPKGIARFENGKFTQVREVPGGWVNAIVSDTHGGIWISYQDLGLMHWVDGRVVERVPWSALGRDLVASSVTPDPVRGGLWLGFFQGGLVHFQDGRIRASYSKNEGLGSGRVMGLQLDKDGSIWAATEGGLSYLKNGRISTMKGSNGLPCDTVHWAVEVDASVWLYTACGLLSVPRSEMEKWTADPSRAIQFRLFDRSDGVRSRALLGGYTPRVSQSGDGQLWFANLQSVSVLDPHHLAFNKTAPPVMIERLIADSKTYDLGGQLRLPARVRDVTIDYTALSFAAPERVRFRYKLQGQDPGWREAVNERQVQYSNLAPAHYRFQVVACNNSGVWNEQGDTLEFSVSPTYYQTNWFRALCAGFLLLLIWAAYQLRVRQLRREFALTLDARVGERTTIARELHDTLLQSFHGLMLRFQSVSELLPERPMQAKEELDKTIERAAGAITEGRDAVQGLRESTVQTNDLAQALNTLGEELAAHPANHRSPAFRVTVEGEPRDLHPVLRDEIYRIAAEALRNTFRHADAGVLEVEIRYDNQQFRLRVRDDGKGMDPALLSGRTPQGHYGLPGMRERAKLIGGNLTVWSEPDMGTEVDLRVPATCAYTAVRTASWLSRTFSGRTKAQFRRPT